MFLTVLLNKNLKIVTSLYFKLLSSVQNIGRKKLLCCCMNPLNKLFCLLQLILQSLDDPSVVGSLLIQAVENSISSTDSEASLVDVVSGVMQLLNILLRRAGKYVVRF